MSYYDFSFEGPVERLKIGDKKALYYTVIILPDALIADLPFGTYPRLRIIGEVADCPVRGAWQPVGDGRKYFILSAKFLEMAGLCVGDLAEMRFNIDDQDYIEVPAELEAALQDHAHSLAVWTALSPGKKRFLAHRVLSAKTPKTINARIVEIMEQLKEMT